MGGLGRYNQLNTCMLTSLRKAAFGKFVKDLKFVDKFEEFKTFRVIDMEGTPVSDAHKNSDPKLLNQIFQKMIMLDETDRVLYMA